MDKMKSIIEECMENISMDESMKTKISEINVNENSRSEKLKMQKSKNSKVTMRRIWKNTVSIAACLVLLFAVTSVGTYALSGKSIFEAFFENSEPSYAKELLDYNGQSYTIDEYTITLEQTLYDSSTGIGYCVFAISKEGGKTEADINQFNQINGLGYGNDERFNIEQFASWGVEYEFIGNVLYQYISFTTDINDYFEGNIRLMDMNHNTGEVDYYEFAIKESTRICEYHISKGMNMVISPLGMSIYGYNSIDNVCLVLHYNNDEKEIVVDTKNDIGIGGSNESISDSFVRYQYVFKEVKDITKIQYVELNGKKYYAQ